MEFSRKREKPTLSRLLAGREADEPNLRERPETFVLFEK
jgi:hypothetical protein